MSNQPQRVIALASGKGGVGRSTIALELARALARQNKACLLVDLSPNAAAAQTLLFEQRAQLGEIGQQPKGIELLTLSPEEAAATLPWREREVGWVVLDLPGGFELETVQLFIQADYPLLVTIPEPTAIVAADAFLKQVVRAQLDLLGHDGLELDEALYDYLDEAPDEWSFQAAHEVAPKCSAHLKAILESLRVGTLLNYVRESSEWTQVSALCHAWSNHLGLWPTPMASIRFDDRRWFFARRLAPAPVAHATEESFSGDIEALAETLNKLDPASWMAKGHCLAALDPERDFQAFIFAPLEENSEPRQLYRRLWEAYRRDQGLVSYLYNDNQRQHILEQLDLAYKTLTTMQSQPEEPPAPPKAKDPGCELKEARLRLELGLAELSQRTRIGVPHLEAIESMQHEGLPSRVYLRAYLLEIARTLGLEPSLTTARYLTALDAKG